MTQKIGRLLTDIIEEYMSVAHPMLRKSYLAPVIQWQMHFVYSWLKTDAHCMLDLNPGDTIHQAEFTSGSSIRNNSNNNANAGVHAKIYI